MHKNYLVWVHEIEWEETLDQFTFQICACCHNDTATHLKWSLGEWLVEIYKLAKLRLTKPKLYILNKIHFLSYSNISQNRTNISYHFSFRAAAISFSRLKQSKRKIYAQHYLMLWWNITYTVTKLQGHII